MKARELKYAMEFIGLINNLIKGLNINKEAIAVHSNTSKELNTRMEGYSNKYKDPEYMKTLSPPEQKALMDNARNAYSVYQNLSKEIDYLEMTKHHQFIINAANAFDNAYITTKYFYEEVTGECKEIMKPKFSVISIKDFLHGKYVQQILSLLTELEAFTHDFYVDHKEYPGNIIHQYLAQGYMWIKFENERLKIEALPEVKNIPLPAEVVPEIPKEPLQVVKDESK